MYRSSCFLSKPNILCSRYNSASSQPRKVLEKYGSVIKGSNINYGRLMSTQSKVNRKNRLFWGYSVVAGVLFGSSVTLLSKHNAEFREAFEDSIPISKYAFNYLISQQIETPLQDDSYVVSEVEEHCEQCEVVDETEENSLPDDDDDDVLVVNIMDTPYASQIDFEVGNKHEVEADDLDDVLVEEIVQNTNQSSEDIDDAPKEEVEVTQHMIEEVIAAPTMDNLISDVEEAVIYAEKEGIKSSKDVSNESLHLSPFSGAFVFDEREVFVPKSLNNVFETAFEGLKIIIDDVVSEKTSASGMMHGYVTQFSQALLVSKDDPAYDTIWEASAVLENNVKESIHLVKEKEAEVNTEIKKFVNLIYDVRKFGVSDIADKVEELITMFNETLLNEESEIVMSTNKLNFLLSFQKRIEGSSKKLQDYLEDFKPDLIKLLNSQQYIDAQNLTHEDGLLMLSLRRPELIYSGMGEKETDLIKEADEHLIHVLQKLVADKDDELKLKVEELNELHETKLQEELQLQSASNQEELEKAIVKQEIDLRSQHKEEMDEKLNEQGDEHYFVIEKNLSYLNGIKSKITEIIDLSEQQQRSQKLWIASQALTSALNNSLDNGRTRSLMQEIDNVMQCDVNDDILLTIIASMPKGAANLGVIPESALMQRFTDVKRVCKRVAMVKEDGGSIFAYTFSYIKSIFVISRFYQRHISEDLDLETIGPYEILEKADYYIQKGDLVQAAKFMSQLKGVPRKLCDDWLKEVRLLLETKQSANLLMAYAGSFMSGFE